MSAAASSGIRQSLRNALKAAAEETTIAALKRAIKDTIKTTAEKAVLKSKDFVKNIGSKFGKNVKGAAKESLETTGQAAASKTSFIAKNYGKIIGGVAVGTLAGVAYDKFLRLNNKEFTIKAIKYNKIGAVLGIGGKDTLYIEYIDPEKDELYKDDLIVITESDSVPITTGTYSIISADNSIPFIVVGKHPDDTEKIQELTKNGETGKFTYKTTFDNQVAGTLGDTVGEGAKTVGDVTGKALDALGIPEEWYTAAYIFIGFIIFMILFGIGYKIYDIVASKNPQVQQVAMPIQMTYPENYSTVQKNTDVPPPPAYVPPEQSNIPPPVYVPPPPSEQS